MQFTRNVVNIIRKPHQSFLVIFKRNVINMTRKLQQGFQVIFTTNVVGRCSPGNPGESNQFLVKFHQVLSVQAVFAQKHSMCTDESVLQWSRKKVNEGWTWFFKSRKFPMLISFCMLSRSCTSSVACSKPDINQHCHSALPSWNTRPRLAWYISICKLVRVQAPLKKKYHTRNWCKKILQNH